MKELIKFLNSLSNKLVLRINLICLCIMIIIDIFDYKFHIKGGVVILLHIPLIWLSVTLLISTALAKVVSSEVEMKKKIARIAIPLGILMIIISIIGPIILYFLWLHADAESDRLRQLIQQHP